MTTDGVRRPPRPPPPRPATHAPARGGAPSTSDAPATRPAATRPAATSAAVRGLDVLDAAKGTSSAPSSRKRGSLAALVGLGAVDARATGTRWRAALAGVLMGLSVIGGAVQSAAAAEPLVVVRSETKQAPPYTKYNSKLLQESGAPPPPMNALNARILANVQQPTPVLDAADVAASLAAAAHDTAPAPGGGAPSATTGATTSPTTSEARPALKHGGLPDTLATLLSGVRVVHGTDPGDFYCEHAFFTSTSEALRAGSSILKNAHGEVLTGFLHNPSDDFTYTRWGADADKPKVQSARHAERRDVVGAAIRGFYEDARAQIDARDPGGAFRLLLTGYAGWGSVVDNPTGDFVAHRENVDAAMHRAFGDALVMQEGRVVDEGSDAGGMTRQRLEYQVKDASAPGGVRTVVVEAAVLPVTDDAINGGNSSLQALIRGAQPHAVMSMGVAGSGAYQAEFHADDGGLNTDELGVQRHDDGRASTTSHPDNWALGRAILRGQQIIEARPIVGVPLLAVPGAGVVGDVGRG